MNIKHIFARVVLGLLSTSQICRATILSDVDVQKIAASYSFLDVEDITSTKESLEGYALSVSDQGKKIYSVLIETLAELEYASNSSGAKQILTRINGLGLSEWQDYFVRVANTKIAALDRNNANLLQSLDWLIEHSSHITDHLSDPACRALTTGLERGQGSFIAEMLYAKAGIFQDAGRTSEALALYQRVVTEYPGTGWAKKASNNL